MLPYTIRLITRDDIPAIIVLCREHAEYERAAYLLLDQHHDLPAALFAETPRLFCWVVASGSGDLIGYCTYMLEYSTWKAAHFIHMDCLYLKEEARNQQLGRRLMQKMIAHARELQIDEIQWQTPESNEAAIRFYKRLGALPKNKVRFFLDPFQYLID